VLTPDDLRSLLQLQQATPPEERRPIAHLAVEQGFFDEAGFRAMLDRHCRRLHLGEILVLRRLISLTDLDRAVREQQKSGGLLGEILIGLGLLTPQALCEGLAQQSGVPFVPIANIPPKPGLARWVNAAFARLHGVIPIACEARRLTVAIWQPRSLAIVSDLEQATGLKVSVVLTTRGEIEERFGVVYGEAG
jgi:hypothetical protein